ncbi:MAG: cadmium-translocating P-type ATPase [Firmicutes bacterium]|nr:cadmium-translocating P-type ATPase [Candidatus Fermentithermobacillaceae bacterium]
MVCSLDETVGRVRTVRGGAEQPLKGKSSRNPVSSNTWEGKEKISVNHEKSCTCHLRTDEKREYRNDRTRFARSVPGWRGHDHGHPHANQDAPESALLARSAPLAGALLLLVGFVLKEAGFNWYRWAFAVAMLVAGIPVGWSGFGALVRFGRADINLLTTVAAVGAFALGDWAEAALVLTLFGIGEYLEEKASERSRRSIRALLELVPDRARRKAGDEWVEVRARDLLPGDVVLVLPGESIPADGEVSAGDSSVNEASITGESLPVDKRPGDKVFAGTLNGDGALEIRVLRPARDTVVSKIASLVEEYSSQKAPSQRVVDAFARYWTPAMLLTALVVSVLPPLLLGMPWKPWVYRGLTLLIVSCPCALVVSTPATVISAIARAASKGVLIKGGTHLETLGVVKAVAFDKTGTLTTGKVRVSDVVPAEGFTRSDVLAMAASVESRSEHPLAQAVTEESRRAGIRYVAGEEFAAVRGRGARAKVDGRMIYVGNERFFLEEVGIRAPQELQAKAHDFKADGKTAVFVGDSSNIVGLIAFSDSVRPDAREALKSLEQKGVRSVVMLTGDDKATASSVAKEAGLKHFRSDLLPEEKVSALQELRSGYGKVAMVGDGVNDAPSLAAADVGIAMGPRGADISLEASDVVVMKDDLTHIPWVVGLAQRARMLIIQNIVFSMGIKLASIVLVFFGFLPLWVAVLADSGTTVLVTLNGLRILRYRG